MSSDEDTTDDDGWSVEWLLSIDRTRVGLDSGHWWTVRVTKVEPSPERPHGLEYSLTFHTAQGKRVIGFDNAHPIDVATGPARRSKRPTAWDHQHYGDKCTPYEFASPAKLVEDFFEAMNKYLREEGLLP